MQCEEWALMRGECPDGGVKVTGYATDAARFCAITGGEYTVTDESGDQEQGTCTARRHGLRRLRILRRHVQRAITRRNRASGEGED
ncbi:MAG: hypothetical protein R3A10_19215 [Caldilineaceae bacterium]